MVATLLTDKEDKGMNSLIKESPRAMLCVEAVLNHAGIDYSLMSTDAMIDSSRSITARCRHNFKGQGTRHCIKCGSLQNN